MFTSWKWKNNNLNFCIQPNYSHTSNLLTRQLLSVKPPYSHCFKLIYMGSSTNFGQVESESLGVCDQQMFIPFIKISVWSWSCVELYMSKLGIGYHYSKPMRSCYYLTHKASLTMTIGKYLVFCSKFWANNQTKSIKFLMQL